MSALPADHVLRRTRVRPRVHEATVVLAVIAAAVSIGCEPPSQRKPLTMVPIGTSESSEGGLPPRQDAFAASNGTSSSAGSSSSSSSSSGGPTEKPAAAMPSGPCAGAEIDNLESVLKSCEVPMPKAAELPGSVKDKLEVTLSSTTPAVSPGGSGEVTLTLKNKHTEPLPLFFSGDPPHFEVEILDGRGRRANAPKEKSPADPDKGRDTKAARVTLAPGGVARLHLTWHAVKLKWAPEKLKTWDGRGSFPTAPDGPLPRGKYTLRAVVPLLGVFERGGIERPKTSVDVR